MFLDWFTFVLNTLWGTGTWCRRWGPFPRAGAFSGRGWKEWKQDSEAGNFANDSASAKIGGSLLDQIKGIIQEIPLLPSLNLLMNVWLVSMICHIIFWNSNNQSWWNGEEEKVLISSVFSKGSIYIERNACSPPPKPPPLPVSRCRLFSTFCGPGDTKSVVLAALAHHGQEADPGGWGQLPADTKRCTGGEAPIQRTWCEVTLETTPTLSCLVVHTPSVFARHSSNSDRATDFKQNEPQAELLVQFIEFKEELHKPGQLLGPLRAQACPGLTFISASLWGLTP